MTTIDLINLALLKLGVTNGLSTIADDRVEAVIGSLAFDHTLRATLRRFPWPFATKYTDPSDGAAPLLLVRGPLWDTDPTTMLAVQAYSNTASYVPGDVVRSASVNYYCLAATTGNIPPNVTYWSTSEDDAPEFANGDWLYAYRWPTDCITFRRLVNTALGRAFDPNPYPSRVGRDKNGLVIFAKQPEAIAEYTSIDCDALWTDDLWIDAFTWRLAMLFAAGSARNNLTTKDCYALYIEAFNVAATVASQEQQHEKPGDAEWISGRN